MRTRVALAAGLALVLATSAVPVGATTGEPLIAGVGNWESTGTLICREGYGSCNSGEHYSAQAALVVTNNRASGNNGTPIGVYAESDGHGIWGRGYLVGVIGEGTYPGSIGVSASGYKYGLLASTPVSGGVGALIADGGSAGNTALEVRGRVVFSRSGTAVVPANSLSVTIASVHLSAGSMVLATLQTRVGNAAVAAAVPDPDASSIRIYLTKTLKVDVPVAWFVIG